MYYVVVLLLTIVLPIGTAVYEHSVLYSAASWMALVGGWMVFFAGGIRLFLAGLRQTFQPRFTAEELFDLTGDEALPIVRELGFANLSMGTIALLSLPFPAFALPAAIVTGLYYAFAGLMHVAHGERNAKRTVAMLTDLWVFVAEAAFVVAVLFPRVAI